METILWTDQPVDSAVKRLLSSGRTSAAIISLATLLRTPGRDVDARVQRARAVVDAFPDQARRNTQVDLLLGAALAGLGRMKDAREVAASMSWMPDAEPGIAVVPVVGGFAPSAYSDSLQRALDSLTSRSQGQGQGAAAGPNLFLSYWRALFLLGKGDLDGANSMLSEARRFDRDQFPQQQFMFDLLDGAAGALQIQRGDTVAGLAALHAGLEASGTGEGSYPSAPLRLREALIVASRPATRDQGILMLEYGFDYDPQYAAIVQVALGEAYEAKGEHAKAAAAYTEFLALWEKADPGYQPRVAQVREALARVQQAGG
jgi:tetratricopeptide (TPR) repeat protein